MNWSAAYAFDSLGVLALAQGDLARATRCFELAIGLDQALGDKTGVAYCLEGLHKAQSLPSNLQSPQVASYSNTGVSTLFVLRSGSSGSQSAVSRKATPASQQA